MKKSTWIILGVALLVLWWYVKQNATAAGSSTPAVGGTATLGQMLAGIGNGGM